ncbi:MAG: hypothetical protein ACYCWB_00105 [Thiobacillus sp.]
MGFAAYRVKALIEINLVKKGLDQNIVKKADGVGTLAHIAQKGVVQPDWGCRTHDVVMYDAAQTAPPILRIVAGRDDADQTQDVRQVAPLHFLTTIKNGCNHTKSSLQ